MCVCVCARGQLAWPTKRVAPTAVTHGEVDGQDGQRWGLMSILSDTAPGESFCIIHIHKYTYILQIYIHNLGSYICLHIDIHLRIYVNRHIHIHASIIHIHQDVTIMPSTLSYTMQTFAMSLW